MSSRKKKFVNEVLFTLKNYISGQFMVAFILSLIYIVGFSLVGLSYSLFWGCLLGFLIFIPIFGPLVGFLLLLAFSFYQFGAWQPVLLIFMIYVTGQLLEGYYLTPKLIGKKTGIPPFLVFISILLGGALFGVLGMIFAVPLALVVLIALKYYRNEEKEMEIDV